MHFPSLSLATTALVLALTPSADAQTPVTLRGTPTDGSAAGCYYCPGYEHVIKLVGTQLHSSTVNLLAFHDLNVVMHGTWNGTVVEVTSVQLDAESFSISGNTTIGHRASFSTFAPAGSLAANCVAFGPSFTVPAADLAFQLQPATALVMEFGPIGSGGELKSRLDIPDEPSLIGLRLFGQGLVLPANGAPWTTNVDMKTVQ